VSLFEPKTKKEKWAGWQQGDLATQRKRKHEENDVRSVLLSLESVLPSGRTRRKLASRGVVLLLLGDLVELFKDGGEGVAVGGRHDGLGGLDGRGRRGARSGSVGGDGRGVGGLGGGRVFGRRGDAKRGAAEGARKWMSGDGSHWIRFSSGEKGKRREQERTNAALPAGLARRSSATKDWVITEGAG
jgi:hypothetical protein